MEIFARAWRGNLRRKELGSSDEGFTFIETLVVVVVLGILVAVAIPVYRHYTANSETRSIQSDVRNAVIAVQACADENDGKVSSGTVTTTGAVYLTCNSDGSGTASDNKPAGGADQVINLSPGVQLSYLPGTSQQTFAVVGTIADGQHVYVRYDSSTGKTDTTAEAPCGSWFPASDSAADTAS